MRTKLANWTRLAVVVVVVAGTQTGCKSGWKMPGSDMFSWSRKPSESTLAGSSPSLSMPTSPATKNTPSPLAGTAANGVKGISPYTPSATNPGFGAPPSNQFAAGGAGAAAGANGYTTGQYGMAANQARPNTPAPYGASPTGYVASNTNAFGQAPQSNSFAGGQPPALPPAYGGQPLANSASSLPAMGNASLPAMPAGYNPGMNTMPNQNNMPPSSMPNAVPSYQPTAPSVATQAYNGAAPYRPGSVGRSTGYDFSTQGPGAVANTSLPPSSGAGLPPSVPATANSYNNPANLPGGMYR